MTKYRLCENQVCRDADREIEKLKAELQAEKKKCEEFVDLLDYISTHKFNSDRVISRLGRIASEAVTDYRENRRRK